MLYFPESVKAQSKHIFGLEDTTPNNDLLLKETVSAFWIHKRENMRIHRGTKEEGKSSAFLQQMVRHSARANLCSVF